MLTTTLASLRDAIMRTAGAVAFTDTHPPAYVNDLANRALGALSTVCRTTNPRFQPIQQGTITTDGVATIYPLPLNFRSLISVEYTHDGHKRWLEPLSLNERAKLTDPDLNSGEQCASGYLVNGATLELLPKCAKGDVALFWYATDAVQLVKDDSKAEVMDRLDTYVIWWAAREIANEREAWERYDRLSTQLANLEAHIRILARSVDLSGPSRVQDDRLANPHDRYGRRYLRGRMR